MMEWIGKEPWGHQRALVENATRVGEYGMFAEMGTGKSYATINCMRWWYKQNKRVLRTLILTPPIVIEQFRRQIGQYSKIHPRRVVPLVGTGKKRAEIFARAIENPEGTIFITNYESLIMADLYKQILKWEPEIIVVDESHVCKERSSRRTKLVTKLADRAKHRLLLSGTPIGNGAMDIFSQFRILDRGETFGTSFIQFRANYFYDANANMPRQTYFPNWKPREDTYERLNAKIRAKSMVIRKEDCLTLPPLVVKDVYVELSAAQRKAHDEMKRHLITYVEGDACVANLALTKALRLMQIVSGFANVEVQEDDGTKTKSTVRFKDDPRAVALRDLLAEITTHAKCLVWAVWQENYDTIRAVCDELKIQYVEIHGDVSAANKQKAVDAFRENPDIKVCFGHPGSGGVGVDMIAASYSIFYSRNFSMIQYLQAQARNYRGGSGVHERITQINLLAAGTIDERVAKMLTEKTNISDQILLGMIAAL